jgi:hypothetical protein
MNRLATRNVRWQISTALAVVNLCAAQSNYVDCDLDSIPIRIFTL